MCYDANRNSYLMLWANGTVSDLGTLTTGAIAIVLALSMNNNGQIAGWFGSGNGGNQGFLYNNGTLTLQSSFLPEAINDQKFSKAAHTICGEASKAKRRRYSTA